MKSDKSPSQIRNPEISNWTPVSAEVSIKTARTARQFNLRFWISALRWAFVRFQILPAFSGDATGMLMPKLGDQWLAGSNPLLEGGGATPIKRMQRYLSFGVTGEVRP